MLQDFPQFHELYPSSCSDLVVEVVSEVTDSQANRPLMQDSTHPDGPLPGSYPTSVLKGVVSEAKESEAVRLLAARIPPELFDNILYYVNVHCTRSGTHLERKQGGRTSRDMPNDLTQCSLVCLFWANRCRQHMFSERTLEINSYQDAEIFRRHVVGGRPRLTPVYQLIDDIVVRQDYESGRSFLHLLYLPAIQDKLKSLTILGPVPVDFNPAKLDTPHWGIPPCIVLPSSFLQKEITIEDVHLPSFYHVAKYIRHFTCATYIQFEKISWDGHTPMYSFPQASNRITCKRRPRSLMIRVYGDCTNSLHLALTALMMDPNCPLHRLSDQERVWMIKFMTLLWGDKKNPYVEIGFDVSEQATTMYLYPFHFVFEETSAYTDRSASALSVVGMHAYIVDHSWRRLPANFDALVTHTRTHPTIRALVLLFESLDRLQNFVKPFIEVLVLAAETIELVLAYEEEEEDKAVSVDLVTLEPNDRIWTDLPVLTYNTYGVLEYHFKSLYILQRQLEKKPRGRLH
ncbi:hypothetical protein BC629DRAFT_1592465 [Irpex lacteus]|nr:hypothetical protein BC629DRAFT_1592465 [Irpex lacteus]